MSGSTPRWDQPPDPRESTVDLPRLLDLPQSSPAPQPQRSLPPYPDQAAEERPRHGEQGPAGLAEPFPAGLGLTGPYVTAAELRARFPDGLRMLAADAPVEDVPPAGPLAADDDQFPADPGADGRPAGIGLDRPAAPNGNGHAQNGSWRPGGPAEHDGEGLRPLGIDDRNRDDGPAESQPAAPDYPPGPADSQPAAPDSPGPRESQPPAPDYPPGPADSQPAGQDSPGPRESQPAAPDYPPGPADSQPAAPDYPPGPADSQPAGHGYSPGAQDYRPVPPDYSYRVFPQDRPAHGALDDLRRRLELLPAGHPSSPYEDDGSRQQGPPRLRHLELPLSDDERDTAAHSRRTAAATPDTAGNGAAAEALFPVTDWQTSDDGLASAEPESRNGSAPPEPAVTPADVAPADVTPADAEPAASPQPAAADAPEPHVTGLTTEQLRIAEQALTRFRTAEGRNVFGSYGASGITPAISRVAAQLPSGGLAPGSERDTLKDPERFRQKLASLIARNPDMPAEQLVTGVCDAIRYAFTFEPADYTDGTWLVHRRLKAQGFELEVRRNRWDSPEYKGIRTQWRDPAHDLPFEVQFHTTASWEVLQRTHAAYLTITDPATPPAERARLRARQVAASTAAPAPSRCAEIADFRLAAR